jgi:chloramphenicol 3-O-phosphotransferase
MWRNEGEYFAGKPCELHIRTTHCVVVGVTVSQYARRERGNREGGREGGSERARERERAHMRMEQPAIRLGLL